MMPEIFRTEGYVFFFFSNESQEPMHVHVRHAGGHAKFWMMPITLEYAEGLKVQELKRAEDLILENENKIRSKWHEVFGF